MRLFSTKIFFVSFFLLFPICQVLATDLYVRSGGGNFNAAGTWSLSSNGPADGTVPTANDDIYLDANSGALTITAAAVCRSIDCTGYTNTLTHNAAVSLTIGSFKTSTRTTLLKFVAGMTYTLGNASTSSIVFTSTYPINQTIDFGGKITGNVTYNSSTGKVNWTLLSGHTCNTTATVTLSAGYLDTNGQTMSWGLFSSGGANTGLTLGSSNISLTGTGNVWNFGANNSGFFFTPNTSTISITDTSATLKTFVGNSNVFNNLTITGDNVAISGSNTFNILNVNNGGRATGLKLTAGTTQTVSNFTTNGSAGNLAKLISATGGTAATISKASGAISVDYMSIQDITATTTGNCVWYAGGNSTNVSGNNGWIFNATSPAYRYWVVGGINTNWSETSNWSLTSGGAGGASVPTSSEMVFLDQNSGTGFSDLDVNTSIRSINCSGFRGTLRHASGVKLTIGSAYTSGSNTALKFVSTMTYTLGNATTSSIDFVISTTPVQTVDFANKIVGDLNFNGAGGSWQLTGDFTTSATTTVTLTNGTLNFNSRTVSFGLFNSNNANTRAITLGASNIALTGVGNVWDLSDVTNLTVTAGSSVITVSNTTATAKTFIGGDKAFDHIAFSGDNITVTGSNTFKDMRVNNAGLPNGLLLTAGTTQSLTGFVTNGYAGNLAILKSTSAGVAATITKATGRVSVDYMSIQDSTAATSGTATWFAGTHSLNVSGNGGGVPWSFAAPSGKYWVGGGSSSNWNATAPTNWANSSGGANNVAVPTSADDVFFDGNSGSGNSIISAAAACRSLNMTGYVGTLTHNAFTLSIGDSSPGIDNVALKFDSAMTYTIVNSSTSAISFVSTASNVQSVSFAGKTTGTVDYNGSGGSWKLTSVHNTIEAAVKLTTGTLDTNNINCTWGAFYLSGNAPSGSTDNARTLSLGSSNITLRHTTLDPYTFYAPNVTNLTVIPNSATVIIAATVGTSGTSAARAFRSSGIDWKGLSLTYLTEGGAPTTFFLGKGGVIKNVTVIATDTSDLESTLTINNFGFKITGSLTLSGFSAGKRLRFSTNGPNGASAPYYNREFDITGASISCTNVDFNGIGFVSSNTNEVPVNLSSATGGSGDLGNNSGITFTTSTNLYWYTSTTGTKSWSDSSYWFLGSGGTGGNAGRIPLAQDNAVFDANSFATAGCIVNVDRQRLCKNITWTGVTNSPDWYFSVNSHIFGNLVLDAGMTMSKIAQTSAVDLYFNATTPNQTLNITTSGVAFPHNALFMNMGIYTIQNMQTNTINFVDNFTGNSSNTTGIYTTGTVNLNNNTITVGQFKVGQITGAVLNMGGATLRLTGVDGANPNTNFTEVCMIQQGAICGTSTIELTDNSSYSKSTFNGSQVFYNFLISGNCSATYTFVNGDTYNNFTDNNTLAHTLRFNSGTTSTFLGNISVKGSAGNPVTLTSINTGVFTWSKASGTVDCEYLILSKSTATGGATFNAASPTAGSTVDGGNNTGWNGLVTNSFTWTRGNGNDNWNDPLNWQGGSAPGNTDIAYFTGAFVGNCSVNIDPNCAGIRVLNGYTGTITQNSAMTIGTSGFDFGGGTFAGGNQAITCSGYFKQSGGAFTSTSNTFSVASQGSTFETFLLNGGTSFLHNNGTIKITGTLDANVKTIYRNESAATITRYLKNFEMDSPGTLNGNIRVWGNFIRTQGTVLNANITLNGDYLPNLGGTVSDGTGTITFTATNSTQNFSYLYAPNVSIGTTSSLYSNAGTLVITNNAYIGGNWTQNRSTLDGTSMAINWNSKSATFNNSNVNNPTITRGTFYDLVFNKPSTGILSLSGLCTVSNDFTVSSLATVNASTYNGNIEVSGNYVNNDSSWDGTSKIVFRGSGSNTYTGSGNQGVGMEVYKTSSGSVTLFSNLNIPNTGHDLVVRSGNLNLSTYNLSVNDQLTVYGTMTLSGLSSQVITVSGTTAISSSGNFTLSATSSTVIYSDGAGTAVVTNLKKNFYNLTLGASKTHEFATGAPNATTINGRFASNGTSGTRSILRSLSDVATDWKLTLNGTSTLSNKVNVKRSDASGGLGVLAVGSINSGNNTNWVGLVTPPTITSITSSTANGTYTTGANISIRINFSETVTLTGTLGINLDSGGVCVINAFTATTATGTYTVGSGQNSSDLTASSVVVSGTVQNASLVDLVTTLPSTNIATGSNIVIDTTAPTVTSVNSSTSNGSYKVGSSISVTVNFSESVTVTGTPTLLLETGATDRTINYVSGSGSSALVFSYTVQTGDTSSDLDYNATNSLSGTIKDSALNNATLTLASPGAANSLGANKAIIIDTTAPSITSITSSTANGSYKSGSAISIRINFSENITLTGTMGINLDSGGVCVISAFTGTTTTGTYTVASGQTSSDLTASSVVVNTTARDAALNDLSTTLPGTNIATGSNIVIDTTAPTITSITSSTTNGTYGVGANISIRINFSENITLTGTMGINLDSGGVCVISAFTGTTATGTYTVGSSQTSADLTASSVTVNSTARDAALNNLTTTLPSTNIATGSNIVIDTTAPTITTKALGSSNAYIDITFSEAVYTTNTTSGGLLIADFNLAFAANGGTATAVSITGVTKTTGAATSGGETTVRLTLSVTGSVSGTETITITPVAASIFDAAGNAASTSTTTGAVTLQANLPPAVTQVTSSTTNGTYKAGDTVSIQVVFDAAVTVTGTPQLTLETGSTDRTIDYVSGSGSTSLTFTYTVQSGDTSSDLDYTATTALSLNSGTIKSAASINATLVLPTPGTSNSLGSNKALVIDTTAPTVTSVSSTTSDGSYGLASVITISVIFSEAVTVTGVPTLALETGFVDQTASYSSGSGTTTLLFTYTVQSADTSSDLDYSSTTALALSSGTIKDAAGNSATLTLATPGATNSLSSNKAIVIDTTSPIVMTVGSSTADGAYKAGSIISITVTFTEAVVVTGSPTLTLETGTTDRNATYNSGSGSNILVFTYTVQSGDSSSDLDYTSTSALALSSGTIKDAAGNAATLTLAVPGATNSLGSANNIVVDTTSPSITDKALSSGATYVDITFSEPVYTSAGSGALTSADFTVTFVKNGGTATGVAISSLVNTSGVALSGGETVIRAMLTISGAIAGVETFSISPKSNEIFDLAGNASTTTGTGSIAIVDTLSPTVLSVDTTNADGAYKAGSTIVITVTFSEAVTVSGTPSLTLETGLTDAVATYVSGSDTDTLTFAYTVQSGEKSSDLDYKASTALVTNGGSIVDAASNVATLTLVTPGDAGSLNSNADIEIDTTLPTVKKAEMSSNNDYVDITFSEPVFTQAGTGALIPSNFILVTQANAGTSISVTVTSILTTDETALVGGETKVRMHISITGTTKGNEKIVIQTLADTVFDKAGNAMLPLNETVNIKTQTVVGGGSSAGGCTYTPNATLNQNADWAVLLILWLFSGIWFRRQPRNKK